MVLLSYPAQFWPTTEQEVYDYTKQLCDATELAVMLFPLPAWGFERIHPAGMSVQLVRRLLEGLPEHRRDQVRAGLSAAGRHLRDVPPLPRRSGDQLPDRGRCHPAHERDELQFSGTSNTQWMSDYYPRAFELARTGRMGGGDGAVLEGQPGAQSRTARATQAYIGGTPC